MTRILTGFSLYHAKRLSVVSALALSFLVFDSAPRALAMDDMMGGAPMGTPPAAVPAAPATDEAKTHEEHVRMQDHQKIKEDHAKMMKKSQAKKKGKKKPDEQAGQMGTMPDKGSMPMGDDMMMDDSMGAPKPDGKGMGPDAGKGMEDGDM